MINLDIIFKDLPELSNHLTEESFQAMENDIESVIDSYKRKSKFHLSNIEKLNDLCNDINQILYRKWYVPFKLVPSDDMKVILLVKMPNNGPEYLVKYTRSNTSNEYIISDKIYGDMVIEEFASTILFAINNGNIKYFEQASTSSEIKLCVEEQLKDYKRYNDIDYVIELPITIIDGASEVSWIIDNILDQVTIMNCVSNDRVRKEIAKEIIEQLDVIIYEYTKVLSDVALDNKRDGVLGTNEVLSKYIKKIQSLNSIQKAFKKAYASYKLRDN